MLFTGVLFMTACTTLKRYTCIKKSGIDNTLAKIDLFGFRLSPAKPEDESKTLWDLSADAQSQLIKILNSRYPDNEMFISSLNNEYLDGTAASPGDDYTSKDLRLIFSVSKKRSYSKNGILSGSGLTPADRIEYLKISLKIPEESCLRFTGWNMYSTEYGSIDIADLSFSRNLEIDASLLEKGNSGELSAGGKSTITRKEDQAIKYRYLKLNGRISKKKIEMEEEGNREIDLTGNIIADVSLEFDKFPERLYSITGLIDSTGKYNNPDKLALHYTVVYVPLIREPYDTIRATIKLDFIYRNVVSGRRTFQEWDDRIKYFKGTVEDTIPFMSKSDFMPHFYCIGNETEPGNPDYVKIETSPGELYLLKFRTYEEASGFYYWLRSYFSQQANREKSIMIGEQTLKFRGSDLTYNKAVMGSGIRVLPYY